ncbi:MAG: TRAP transporter small permease subunit [Notoacmeibacter sp.]|nr:TRAP transporter small permease subunit [Notoacmeibacter sp.]
MGLESHEPGIAASHEPWLARLAGGIDRMNIAIGRAASWLYAVLMVVVVANVTMRYGFNRGSIMMEEIQWHLLAVAFFLGFAYAYAEDAHVRVDIIHERLSRVGRARVEFTFTLFFLVPFAALLARDSWVYFLDSWAYGEVSPEPGGLPARYVVKFFLPVSFVLLLLQALSVLIKTASVCWPRQR